MAKSRASFSFSEDEPIKEGSPSEKIPKNVEKKESTLGAELRQHTIHVSDEHWHLVHGYVKQKEFENGEVFAIADAFAEYGEILKARGVKPWTKGLRKNKS